MGELASLLAEHTIIGLDTSPFIYLFERHPRYHPLVVEIFSYTKHPDVRAITSVITLIETCVQPKRDKRDDLVEIYEQALLNSKQVHLVSIGPALARRAVELRVRYSLRIPDALQIAAALEHGATLFVTNDRRLRRVTELFVLILEEYAESPAAMQQDSQE